MEKFMCSKMLSQESDVKSDVDVQSGGSQPSEDDVLLSDSSEDFNQEGPVDDAQSFCQPVSTLKHPLPKTDVDVQSGGSQPFEDDVLLSDSSEDFNQEGPVDDTQSVCHPVSALKRPLPKTDVDVQSGGSQPSEDDVLLSDSSEDSIQEGHGQIPVDDAQSVCEPASNLKRHLTETDVDVQSGNRPSKDDMSLSDSSEDSNQEGHGQIPVDDAQSVGKPIFTLKQILPRTDVDVQSGSQPSEDDVLLSDSSENSNQEGQGQIPVDGTRSVCKPVYNLRRPLPKTDADMQSGGSQSSEDEPWLTDSSEDCDQERHEQISAADAQSVRQPVSSLKPHLPKKKPFVCKVCNKAFSYRSLLKRHIYVHMEEKQFLCEICEGKFSCPSSLSRHMRIHSGLEKPVVCDICDKTFASESNLKQHLPVHAEVKPYACEMCDKAFSYNSSLRKHMHVHMEEKPCVCEVCNKRFACRSSLCRHLRTHTGDKRFVCNVCSKRFIENSSLEDHLRVHTGEKPYVCETCDRRFAQRSTLAGHVKIHSGEKPFTCGTCDKRFSLKSGLKKHLRVHGENPFACEVCSKKFSTPSALAAHFRRHTGEKQFTCEKCTKGFYDKSDLNRHMRSMHADH